LGIVENENKFGRAVDLELLTLLEFEFEKGVRALEKGVGVEFKLEMVKGGCCDCDCECCCVNGDNCVNWNVVDWDVVDCFKWCDERHADGSSSCCCVRNDSGGCVNGDINDCGVVDAFVVVDWCVNCSVDCGVVVVIDFIFLDKGVGIIVDFIW